MSPNPHEGEAAGTREAVTTQCLAGGIGLPMLHEAREASLDGFVLRPSGR